MEHADEKFKFVIPATLEKGNNGEWRVYGLASTSKRDLQGETVDIKGLDLTPIEKGKGVFNFDHKKGPENTVGIVDKYKKSDEGLYLGGYLFQEHDRAKALYQIMSSLKKSDRGRVGMSVEGVIKKRDGDDGKTISKAVISACAFTMNPINEDTYADLVKSFGAVEFETEALGVDPAIGQIEPQEKSATPRPVAFSTEQVVALMSKSLGVGTAYATSTPAQLTGGDALAQEDLDKDRKKRKKKAQEDHEKVPAPQAVTPGKTSRKMRKLDAGMYKSAMDDLLTKLQKLYPDASRSELWETVKDRLNRKFGEDQDG